MAVAVEAVDDLVRFSFEDGELRAFKAHSLHVLDIIELPDDEAAAIRTKLARKKPSAAAALRKKAKAKSAAKAATAAATLIATVEK